MRDEHSTADSRDGGLVTPKERISADVRQASAHESASQQHIDPARQQRTSTSPPAHPGHRRHLEHSATLPSMPDSRNRPGPPFLPPPRLHLPPTASSNEHIRRNRSASDATVHLLRQPPTRSPPSLSHHKAIDGSNAMGAQSLAYSPAQERYVLPPLSSLPGSGVGSNNAGGSSTGSVISSSTSTSSSTLPTLSRFTANIRRSNTISSVLHSPLSSYGNSTGQAGRDSVFALSASSSSPFRPLSSGTNRPSSLSVSSIYPPPSVAAAASASSSPHRIFSRNFSSESSRAGGNGPPFQRIPLSPPLADVSSGMVGAGVMSPSSSSTITSSSAGGERQRGRQDSLVLDTGGDDGQPRKLAKTHVPSACLNCKRAHLACDVNRPCRRCVNLGKTETCIDVRHKKRGRPRLRDRDPSVQSAHRTPEARHATAAAGGARSSVQLSVPPHEAEPHMLSSAVMSMIYSTSLYCVRCSVESGVVLGYDAMDLLDRSLFDLVHPTDLSRIEGLWTSLLNPVHIRPQGLHTHPDVIASLSPADLMAPAKGTVFLQEDYVHLRQRNGHYRAVSVRLHLGGGMGADLYRDETLDRAYIVASIHPQDEGAARVGGEVNGDGRSRRRMTESDSTSRRPSHPHPNLLRQARWHDGVDPRHFVTPAASHSVSDTSPPNSSSSNHTGFTSSGHIARDDGKVADAKMRGRRQQPMHMVVC